MKHFIPAVLSALLCLLVIFPLGINAAAEISAPGGKASTAEELLTALGGEDAGWIDETGTVILRRDVVLTAPIILTGGSITLTGAGSILKRGFTENPLFIIEEGASLFIGREEGSEINTDLSLDGTLNDQDMPGSAICLSGGNLTLRSGIVIENFSADTGAGILIESGFFAMQGGIIRNCRADRGGAIYCASEGTAELSGGHLRGNTADWGGGIYSEGSLFAVGTTIGSTAVKNEHEDIPEMYPEMGNKALCGGAVCTGSGSLLLGDSLICANTAERGGAVYLSGDGDYCGIDGSLIYNSASEGGGGIYIGENAAYLMIDGEIAANSTSGTGGAIYIDHNAYLEILNGYLYSNTADTGGAGYCNRGRFLFSGGESHYNKTEGVGGAMLNYGTFTLAGGSFGYNRSSSGYDGIVTSSTVILTNDAYIGGENEIILCSDAEGAYEAVIELGPPFTCTTTIARIRCITVTGDIAEGNYIDTYRVNRTLLTGNTEDVSSNAHLFQVTPDSGGGNWHVSSKGTLRRDFDTRILWIGGGILLAVGALTICVLAQRKNRKTAVQAENKSDTSEKQ